MTDPGYADPFIEWNEANAANDDGEAVQQAERQADDDTPALADAAVKIAEYALRFGRIDRTVCRHPDGTPESDSDHTVMLAWLAPALASATAPDLDPLLVAAYAAVHDAAEVFAGDTPTLRISVEEREAKAAREQDAVLRWCSEFGDTLPWLPGMILRYETQHDREARFVKAADKITPKLLHVTSQGEDLLTYGMDSGELTAVLRKQREDIGAYAGEFTGLLALYDEMARRAVAVLRECEQRTTVLTGKD